MNPTLDFVDSYESYDHPGESAPVVTTLNRDVFDVNGFDPSVEYLRFDSPDEIFKNRDARFFATLITPNSIWEETKIIIQGGLVKPDGEALIETKAAYEHNGTVYHTYGAEETYQYSGFDTYGGNMTRTGFLLKKFLNLKIDISPTWHQSTSDFMDMRYAEVLLNYAEAVVESGYQENGATEKAKKAINDIRKRAGHTVDIPLTLENVLRERKVELAFENKLYWDMVRRREFHQIFNMKRRQALVPVLDLRGDKPQYIFIRKVISRDVPSTFDPKQYYRFIPDISTTGVVQNPQY